MKRFDKLKILKITCYISLKLANDYHDANSKLIDHDIESQESQLKLSENKIKSMADVAAYKNSRIKNILEKTKLVLFT